MLVPVVVFVGAGGEGGREGQVLPLMQPPLQQVEPAQQAVVLEHTSGSAHCNNKSN